MTSSCPELRRTNKIKTIQKCTLIEEGIPSRYRLQSTDNLDQSESYRKMTHGERDKHKPHKTILMVGETGTGKTTLINTMINYMLGAKREDKVWFEITDDQSDRTSVYSQTSIITVYGFYPQESLIHLTIIDTPGYGDTRGADLDKQIAASFHSLSKSAEGIHELDAVCLVIKATQTRLSDRQRYIFDAVQSLFGRDISENIVLLFTHSDGMPPKNALMAVKEAKIKCALNDKNQPMFFLFNNCQSDAADEEYEMIQQLAWDLSFKGMAKLFKFLQTAQTKTLKMTQDVLQTQEWLEANVCNLQLRIKMMEQKQIELKQTQEALEKNKKEVKDDKNFEYEVEVLHKEKVAIDTSLASVAMCCTVCKENCHYPGCWWTSNIYYCSMIKNEKCRVCSNKCHYTKHVKSSTIYKTDKKKEKKTFEGLKEIYNKKIGEGESLVNIIKEELQTLEEEKIKLVNEAYGCVETLQKIALKTDSVSTLKHTDFLIEKLKEINLLEKAKTLEDMKKRAGEES